MTSTFTTKKNILASKIQEHFWTLNQLNTEDTAYNIPSIFEISGPNFELDALRKALTATIEKHEILRTNFKYSENQIFQVIEDSNAPIDFQICKIENQGEILPKEVIEEIHKPFNLEQDKLLRIKIFEVNETKRFLTLVFHHIIIDLRSKDIFSKELSDLYNKFRKNDLIEETPVHQYLEYSAFHNNWIESEEYSRQLSDWSAELKGVDFSMSLPADLIEVKDTKQYSGHRKYFNLDLALTKKAGIYAQDNALNPFSTLLSTYFALIHRISNHDQISIGVPFTNRRKEEFKECMGCFVNILPIVVNFSDDLSFFEITQRVKLAMLKAHRKQETPFLALTSMAEKGKPLFNSGFTFEHPMQLAFDGVDIKSLLVERKGTQLDLFFTLWQAEEKIHGYVEYSDKLFSQVFIDNLLRIYSTLLNNVITNPNTSISQIDITPRENIDFIISLNNTNCEYEHDTCIHQKLEKQALDNPLAPALIFGNRTLTYQELNNHSNRLAHYLINNNVKVEDRVVICCNRSFEMMIGIFAILKAGAVYLPVNPNDPAKRIEDIVNDAAPKHILTTREASKNLASLSNLVYIDDILNTPLTNNTSNPETGVTSRNLAYIIYTSGSTGIPKGVMIEHHSVLNRLLWMQKRYPIDVTDTLIQKTPITFDVSVWELFWWSITGSRLLILNPNDEKDPDQIIEAINKNTVTTIHFVPTMFSAFLEVIKAKENITLKSLKKIFLSGEALPAKMVNDFNSLNISCPLINLYGPTEATVDVSYYDCPLSTDVSEIYIGKPIDNTQLYVVSSKNKILPVGIPGELIIAGVNLSRGYLNREQLNKEKFFSLTLPDNSTVRAYRTGDLCKLTYKGEIEYLGRIDNMIKIRGFRIELGEIETKILEFPGITNCAVIVHGYCENKTLVAYIQTSNKESFSEKEIKSYLKTKLPEYMVPSFYELIDIFPLTSSGKLNRKALPEPAIFTKEHSEEIPSSNSELEIKAIWEKLLCINNIRTIDNFFDLGGNSLLAIKLSVEINKKFNLSLSPIDIFTYPSIKDICNHIEQKQGANISDSEKRAMQNKQNLLRLRNSRR